jgi:hypothetical protein
MIGIAFVDMLEEGGALLFVKRLVVGAGEAGVEHVFDGELELGARPTSAARCGAT